MSEVSWTSVDQERGRLWERLLAGEVLRVYVASDQPRYALLPHTLGLEVVSGSSHLFDPHTGTQLPEPKVRRIAQKLSEGERWITGFGWAEWDQPFIVKAEAALILTSRSWRLRRRVGALSAVAHEAAGEALTLGRGHGEAFTSGTQIGALREAAGRPHESPARYFAQVSDHLLTEYPHKTIVVDSAGELRRLRHVRVRPGADAKPTTLNSLGAFLLAQRAANQPPSPPHDRPRSAR